MQLISTVWLLLLSTSPMTSANIMFRHGNGDLPGSFLSKEKRIIGGQGVSIKSMKSFSAFSPDTE